MIYISTNLYEAEQLPGIFSLLERLKDAPVGIELFPEWEKEKFVSFVQEYEQELAKLPISLHGPYHGTEHSALPGTETYVRSMRYFAQTLELSKRLGAAYIVFHHNNCPVLPDKRNDMLKAAMMNLAALRQRAVPYGARIVIENVGVGSHGNVLFDEMEFLAMARKVPEYILLDVGHAHVNGWNLERVMSGLSNRIVSYHLHNNDGKEDLHDRIHHGSLDMEKFFSLYRHYTPQADVVLEYGKQCSDDLDGICEDFKKVAAYIAS